MQHHHELNEFTYQIGQHLENVDTIPWIGKTLYLKVKSISANNIHLEIVPPSQQMRNPHRISKPPGVFNKVQSRLPQEKPPELRNHSNGSRGHTHSPRQHPMQLPQHPNRMVAPARSISSNHSNRSLSPRPAMPTSPRHSSVKIEGSRSGMKPNPPAIKDEFPEMSFTYGVKPSDKSSGRFYEPIPLKTSKYDFSLKVPTVVEYIRKKKSIIFEGSRFSGKRQAIIGSVISQVNPYFDSFKPKILVLSFERESAEYFHDSIKGKISHMKDVRLSLCVGSTKVRDNVRELQSRCQIVLGTPARLVDLLSREVLKLDNVSFLVMYCNRHLPVEFQTPLEVISRHLPDKFQYLITYPLGANFNFKLLQSYTSSRFGENIPIVDNTPHFHRLNIINSPLYKRDILWMLQNQQRVGLICDRQDLDMIDMWVGDIHCPITCLIPGYKKLPSKGRERRHYIKQSKNVFKERVTKYEWGLLIILQESVKFAPSSLDGSLDAVILVGSAPKLHDPEYRDHLLVKPGGHVFVNVPDLQFNADDEADAVLSGFGDSIITSQFQGSEV